MPRCLDCSHLDLRAAAKLNPGFPKLGLAKCSRHEFGTATFITTTHARECGSFEPAAPEVVAKRIEWMGEKE